MQMDQVLRQLSRRLMLGYGLAIMLGLAALVLAT
jgi:hypothetical protein